MLQYLQVFRFLGKLRDEMQYLELKNQLNNFLIFSIKDIEKMDPGFHSQRLSEWQKKNYVRKIRQGFYIFSDLSLNEQALFVIGNRIYFPSYISLEMALSIYGIIPESVYLVTSVTSQNTKVINTPIARFSYRHISPRLMFGYKLLEYGNHRYKIAELEKAILDYLYLNPSINSIDSFEGVRFNKIELRTMLDFNKFNSYLNFFKSKSLASRTSLLLDFINND